MKKKRNWFGGPGMLITAAFIGPGTVTVCSLAGATYGMKILWVVMLSIIMTIIFQEMASRLGIITKLDLTNLIRKTVNPFALRFTVLLIIICSIIIGNGAYEAGNIAGGIMGIEAIYGDANRSIKFMPLLMGVIVFLILWIGNYRILEKVMTILVLIMSFSFVLTATITRPDISAFTQGLFIPTLPKDSLLLVLGLTGTTLVPYNLFLHSSLSQAKWKSEKDISSARIDTIWSILIGGIVSIGIVVSASSLQGMEVETAGDLGQALEPLYGSYATYLVAIGLFSAGITSALTAPLAAAYVSAGCLSIPADLKSWKFKINWIIILIIGVFFSSIGFKPVDVIRVAQAANGFLLPIIAILLIWLCSKRSVMGAYANNKWMTLVAGVFVCLVIILGIKTVWSVL